MSNKMELILEGLKNKKPYEILGKVTKKIVKLIPGAELEGELSTEENECYSVTGKSPKDIIDSIASAFKGTATKGTKKDSWSVKLTFDGLEVSVTALTNKDGKVLVFIGK